MRGFRMTLAVLVVAVLSGFAGTARADNASDARAVADRFMTALIGDDYNAVCGLFSPRALAAFGGNDCASSFSSDNSADDFDALDTLTRAFKAARQSSAARRGDFVRKGFTVRQLARAMERIDHDLTVKVGKGPQAAKGQLATTVVLDTRTTRRRVVLYAEGDTGTIYRATGTAFTDPTLKRAGQGVPEAPKPPSKPPTYTIDAVTIFANGNALAAITVTDSTSTPASEPFDLMLVPSARGYLVDDILISLVSAIEALGGG